jgi:hypothetical protein
MNLAEAPRGRLGFGGDHLKVTRDLERQTAGRDQPAPEFALPAAHRP